MYIIVLVNLVLPKFRSVLGHKIGNIVKISSFLRLNHFQ